MDEISIQDARTMYQNCLVILRDQPVFIHTITEDRWVTAWDLKEQEFIRFNFREESLQAPSYRLGYVNLGTTCFYVTRAPARSYKVGFSSNNLVMKPSFPGMNREEHKVAVKTLEEMTSVAMYKTIKGIYPTMEEAYERAKKCRGSVAFDRQFAVAHNRDIYYRGSLVGKLTQGSVEFREGCEYLSAVMPSRG